MNPNLTPREIEVLKKKADGLCEKEISFDLKISGKTVQKHVQTIYRKLGVNSPPTMIKKAIQIGYINLEDWLSTP